MSRDKKTTSAMSGKRLCALIAMLLACTGNPAIAFDLNSTSRTVPAPATVGRAATIMVGGHPQVVNPGQLVTPAEAVAINQIVATGRQSLVVGTAGSAVGGLMNLGNLPNGALTGLTIPRNVTALNDFGATGPLNIGGALLNAGTMYGYSTNAAQTAASINMASLFNTTSGVISTITPARLLPQSALQQLDLNLQSLGSVVNNGVISSSGSLTVGTASGAIRNSGILLAANGDVNLQSSATGSDFMLDARQGEVRAPNGNVNISAALGSANSLSLEGGNWYSNQLNINAEKGAVHGSLGDVSGWVNIKGSAANFGAAAKDLKLGTIITDGDPTYFNTAGSLSLANLPNTGGAALALLASGDVVVTSGTIDTTNASGGNGGALTIMAGANFTTVGSNTVGDTTTAVTVQQSLLPTHGSLTGGAIDLSGVTAINTNGTLSSTLIDSNGGNINLVAFAGTSPTSGRINLGTTGSIVTVGSGTGTNGNILVVAGATSDPAGSSAVILPAMFTGWSPMNSQAGVSGGDVTITTATPQLSGNINIKNGAILSGSGTITGDVTLQPTSVVIGSQGGTNNGNIAMAASLTQWQTDNINYALSQINAFRTANGVSPLTLNQTLNSLAASEAQYMTQTQHFAHITLNGADLTARYKAEAINLIGLGSFGENIGYTFGFAPKGSFDANNTAMENEAPNQLNHRYNLLHYNFVGIGFASIGNAIYLVEDFSDNDPTVASPPNLVTPAYGGIQGGAGMVALSNTNNTLPAIGSSGVLPTSINAAGANIIINAGSKLAANGSILTNGKSVVWQSPGNGQNGGTVTLNAGSDVNLFGVQASGGMGGAAIFGATASDGGTGGTVSITSQNGNINILPGGPCSPCLSIGVAGGSGGQAIDANNAGGNGGGGGIIALHAVNGTINLTALDAGGGGGAGGSGGTSAGAGGAGGAGGHISLNALNDINVSYYLNASGGGGGGAGGSGAGGGGGGGGASLAMGGGGGGSNSAAAGGGGGAGSEIPGYGGASGGNFLEINGSAGMAGSTGAGGAAGLFGGAGGGGIGSGGSAANGGKGGELGQAGAANGTGTISGGAAGNGGIVTLNSTNLQMTGTVADFWTRFQTATAGSNSILALGSNGSVTITTVGSPPTVLNQNANYSSTVKTIPVDLSSTFGNIIAGSQQGSITINGNATNSPFAGGTSSGTVIITENNAPISITNGSNVTPAEWAAVLQMQMTGKQSIVLDSSGTATGGTLTLAANNVPSSGFDTLVVPAGLTLVDGVANVKYGSGMTVNGTFDASVQSGATTVSTTSLTLNGTLIGSGGGLTIQSLGTTFPLNVGANANIALNGGTISATTLNITNAANPLNLATTTQNLNVTSSGDVNITNIGSVTLGTIVAPNLSVTASPNATISTAANITTGNLFLSASAININNALSAAQISLVGNNTSGDFTLGGAGSITSTVGTTIASTVGNVVFAPGSSLSLAGSSTIAANGAGQGIVFDAPLANSGALTLVTSNLVQPNITGNQPTMISALGKGTIANPNGDVVLPNGFTFIGSDLAILAAGNIRATGTTNLNLANTKGDAGSLTLIAGYDFTGSGYDQTFKSANAGVYAIGNADPAGGSIYLPKASINLSTSAVGAAGGALIAIAHGGSSESGMIALGAINVSAANGTAGSVSIIGQGGIHTGAINASGSTGGAVSLVGAAPTFTPGQLTVANGSLIGSVGHAAVTDANGAGILVSGAITTAGSKHQGGDITLLSDAQIAVTGKISANGLQNTSTQAGGNIDVNAGLDVALKGAVTASALPSVSATATGDAGNINISAGALITTAGLQALGSKNSGTGNGGKGGTIDLHTQQVLVGGTPYSLGAINIKGSVDARGGDATKIGVNGGAGGAVTLDAGAVAVTGSILTGGGAKGSNATGGDGTVTIKTYAIQSVPSSLDLTSTTRNIVALPGALFTVGLGGSPNGVGGTISIGSSIVDKKGHPFITSATSLAGGVTISVTGSSGILSGSSITPFDPSTFKRATVTPAEAVALFQTSHANGGAQTVVLSPQGNLVSGGPIAINETEINSINFTAFKLPQGVQLNLSGARPMLNLPSSATLAGVVNFQDAGSVGFINAGSGAFNLTGSVTSPSTIVLAGTAGTWTNSGTIQAGELVLARPSGAALTYVTKSGGTTNAPIRLAATADVGMTMTFKAEPAATFNSPILLGGVPMPALYAASSTAEANNASAPRNVALTFDMAGFSPVVGGSVNVNSIKLTALNTTPLTVQQSSHLTAAKTIAISTSAGALAVQQNVQLQSGVLASGAPNWLSASLLSTKQISSAGGISIKSGGGISIGDNEAFTTNGGNQNITATVGNITIGNNGVFRVMGGNIATLAAGTITGGSGNDFQAKGKTTGTANGGIEFGSGTATGTLASAFTKAGGTQIGLSALSGVTVSQTGGALVVNPASQGSLTLGAGSSLLMNKGVVVFDMMSPSSAITFGKLTLETKGVKPIAQMEGEENADYVLDTDSD